jgi:hypothetical protein
MGVNGTNSSLKSHPHPHRTSGEIYFRRQGLMNFATTFTKTYENRVVLVSNEQYILEDLPNILRHLRREIQADAEVINDTVRIVCNLGVKKFEGRILRKLIVKEVRKVIKEALSITSNRWFNTGSAELPEELEHVMHA